MGDMEFNGTPEEWDALVKKNKEQETLEEAAKHNYPGGDVWTEEQAVIRRLAFKNGAKWQAERMYSEEEVYNLLEEAMKDCYDEELEYHYDGDFKNLKEWFKQFKKK